MNPLRQFWWFLSFSLFNIAVGILNATVGSYVGVLASIAGAVLCLMAALMYVVGFHIERPPRLPEQLPPLRFLSTSQNHD